MADEIEAAATVEVTPEAEVTQDATAPDPAPSDAAPEPEKAVEPDWRGDWREKMAGDDAKELKRLQRFQSPADVYKAHRELERKMSAGDIKAKLPEKPTDEQLTAWRKENGIPEKPEGYLDNLPKGLVIGDDDKPMLTGYLAEVHGENASPVIVAKTLDWYYRQQEEAIAARSAADVEAWKATEDELRGEWGGEYRLNQNSITAFLDAAGGDGDQSIKAMVGAARLPDGTKLLGNAAAVRWLAKMASDANPAGFVSPGSGVGQVESLQAERDGINKVMRENRPAYDKDEKMQARWRTLTDALDKLQSR